MCRSQADGGRRCACATGPRRSAYRRAVYAARVVADRYAIDAAAAVPQPIDAWATRPGRPLRSAWTSSSPTITRTVTASDGTPIVWCPDGWKEVAHEPVHVYDRLRDEWRTEAAGVLRHSDGRYLAYTLIERSAAGGRPERPVVLAAVVADNIDAAAMHLSPGGRARLGFAEPPLEETTCRLDPAEMRRRAHAMQERLVGDRADPEALDEFADRLAQASAVAIANYGEPARVSLTNALLLHEQANDRGEQITGWVGDADYWVGVDREVLPTARAYEVWVPVVRGDGVAEYRTREVYDFAQTVRRDNQPDVEWAPTVPTGDADTYVRLARAEGQSGRQAVLTAHLVAQALRQPTQRRSEAIGHLRGWGQRRTVSARWRHVRQRLTPALDAATAILRRLLPVPQG